MALSKLNNDSFADTAVHGRRNLIINGAMQVAQRDTSSTSSGIQTVDRFSYLASTDATITQSQTAITSGSPYDEGFRSVYRLTASTASSSPATSHYLGYQVYLEAQNVAQSGWNYTSTSSSVTLSFWVKSSVAGTYTAQLRSEDGTKQDQIFEYTLVADTWKKVEHTFTGDSDITINNDNGRGLRLTIWVYLGTDFTSSDVVYNAWSAFATGEQSKDFSQNWMTTTNATFDITGVQLEVGDKATPFEQRSFGEELALCQRYYHRLDSANANGNYYRYNSQRNTGSTGTAGSYHMPVTMRSTPSIGTTGTASNYAITHTGGNTACSSTPAIGGDGSGPELVNLEINVASGLTGGQGSQLMSNNNKTSFIAFDAEL
mgnify:CR=1 FL=1